VQSFLISGNGKGVKKDSQTWHSRGLKQSEAFFLLRLTCARKCSVRRTESVWQSKHNIYYHAWRTHLLSHGLKYSEVINRSTEMHRQDAKIQLQPLTNVGQIKQRQDVQVAGSPFSPLDLRLGVLHHQVGGKCRYA